MGESAAVLLNERKTMESLDHPFIVRCTATTIVSYTVEYGGLEWNGIPFFVVRPRLYCALEDDENLYFLLDAVLGGELFKYYT